MKTWKWVALLLLIGGVAGPILGGIVGRLLFPGPPPEPIHLPSEVVEVESVDNINTIAAQSETITGLEMVAGELRDKITGLKAQVSQFLSVDTGPVEPPEPEIITRIIREACEQEAPPMGRASLEAALFEGFNSDGDLNYGWKGTIRCEIAPPGGQEWGLLVDERFTLENTRAISAAPPAPPRRPQRWTVGAHYALVTDGISFFRTGDDYQEPISVSLDPNRFRMFVGRRWFPLKRYTIETLVWGERGAGGIGAGLDF